jgi:hypothetical protein
MMGDPVWLEARVGQGRYDAHRTDQVNSGRQLSRSQSPG